jgi:hypothetical protein
MKRFLLKSCIFLLFPLLALGWAKHSYRKVYPPEKNYYLAALDKLALVRTQASPRVIFLGGSSAAFGIDSGLIGERLGLHPVNTGLHAGFGLDFFLDTVEPFVRTGDVVVLAPEYEAFTKHFHADPEMFAHFVETDVSFMKTLSWRQSREVLDRGYALHLKKALRLAIGGHAPSQDLPLEVYLRSGFNANGDFVSHHGRPSSVVPPARTSAWFVFKDELRTVAAIQYLNRFALSCRSKGASVFLAHPPLYDRVFNQSREHISRLDELLQRSLEVAMLDKPADSAFPLSHFYDSYYHLTAEGKRIHSEALASRLQTALARLP